MLVDPLPGVDRSWLLEKIQEVTASAINMRGPSGQDPYDQYVRWANDSAQILSRLVSSADVERLVLTRRYWLLQSMAASSGALSTRMLMNSEVDDRVRALEETERSLRNQIERWSRPGVFVVPDTSFYISHPEKLEDLDLRKILQIWEDPVHLLIPIVVVDGLDNLKRSGDRHVRWRAGYTLAVLDDRLRDPTHPAMLRTADFSALDDRTGGIPRGEVTMEIIFDPPGHARLPIDDDEIIDRAVSAQVLAARPITLITYDTGQSTRGRRAGLKVEKLSVERGAEPPPKTA